MSSPQSVRITRVQAEKELHDAALEGDLAKSLLLLKDHPSLFDVVSFSGSRNFLHIATLAGKADIVEEVLNLKPELARNLDSQKSSPLHLAAAEGHLDIAQKLLEMAPEMLWCRDGQGMNPVHVAAMKGKKDFLEEFIGDNTLLAAIERLHHGQTVLHFCIKHRQLDVLKILVRKLGQPYVEAKDKDGDTILDLAVRSNQVDMIKYLVSKDSGINKKTMNSMKRTALDVLKQSPTQIATSSETRKLLSLTILLPRVAIDEIREMRSALMVVAVLTATMAFQSAISPPGGVWQANGVWDGYFNDSRISYYAGDSVMASTHPIEFKFFIVANAGAFIVSVFTIIMLSLGPQYNGFFSLYTIVFLVATSQVLLVVSYILSLNGNTPVREYRFITNVTTNMTIGLVALPVIVYILQLLVTLLFYTTRVREFFENLSRRGT